MGRMWTPNAIRSAEEQYGREHYKQLVFVRRLPLLLGVAVVVALLWAGRWVWRNATVPDVAAPGWPSWGTPAVAVGGLVLVAVVVSIVGRVRRGYGRPSRLRAWLRGY